MFLQKNKAEKEMRSPQQQSEYHLTHLLNEFLKWRNANEEVKKRIVDQVADILRMIKALPSLPDSEFTRAPEFAFPDYIEGIDHLTRSFLRDEIGKLKNINGELVEIGTKLSHQLKYLHEASEKKIEQERTEMTDERPKSSATVTLFTARTWPNTAPNTKFPVVTSNASLSPVAEPPKFRL
jgi:hypothetical protein